MPRKTGEGDGHIVNSEFSCLGEIWNQNLFSEAIGSGIVSETPRGPWADDVQRSIDRGPFRFGAGVPIEKPPMGWDPAQHGRRYFCRPEEVYEIGGLARVEIAVFKSQAPKSDHRLATVEHISRVTGQMLLFGQA